MRKLPTIAVVIAIVFAQASSAGAAARKRHAVVMRSAAGTVIQPTRTIIHNPDGTTTIIVTPRRSYLDPGTESSPGDGKNMDYMLPPDGDPGRPSEVWFYGPDATGAGGYPLPRPLYVPGLNPATPF